MSNKARRCLLKMLSCFFLFHSHKLKGRESICKNYARSGFVIIFLSDVFAGKERMFRIVSLCLF